MPPLQANLFQVLVLSEPFHDHHPTSLAMGSEQHHSKKRKRSSRKEGVETTDAAATINVENEATPPDLKQERDAKKRCRESEGKHDEKQSRNTDNGALSVPTDQEKRSSRFIVFIGGSLMSKYLFCVTDFRRPGNLPYTATKTAVESHLASVEPTAVRLMTMKGDPSRCKGFAFVEFARYDKMELCLTKFHHSIFNDGISDARKINVELT
jgi:nucleolar protein 6